MKSAILDTLSQSRLQTLFQPILDLQTGQVHGHESLIRGPSDSLLHSPLALLKAADAAGLRTEVEVLCVDVIAREFVRQNLDGQLFINLSPGVLCAGGDVLKRLVASFDAVGLASNRVIIELTEDNNPPSAAHLIDSLVAYQAWGLRIALDDFGEGFSSLRRWADLRPHYVKIDKHFTAGINHDPLKLQFVRSLQQMASDSGAQLVAEGIESRGELALMREIGVRFGQGYFIGRPSTYPALTLEVIQMLKATANGVRCPVAAYQAQARRLLTTAPALHPRQSNAEALELFLGHPNLHALAVVDNGQPIGLVNRYILIDHFSRIFIRELHGRRACTQFMDPKPLVVDTGTPIEELSRLVVSNGKANFNDGFIITENGRYLGLGSGYDLMQLIMQVQVTTARHSNPLTLLPGNVPISSRIERLIEERLDFTAIYADLDNFKPFNDCYGYEKGDRVILLLAEILKDNVDPCQDFLGHIGGDDFFLLLRSPDWAIRCQAMLDGFQAQSRALYAAQQLTGNGYQAEDRQGRTVFHSLPSLSLGVVPVRAGDARSHHEVATAAAVAKREAKKIAGNSLFVERRRLGQAAEAAHRDLAA